MQEQAPITTATATVKVVVDRADYDALKKEMEQDFADLKEKFAGIFKVQLDELKQAMQEIGGGSKGTETRSEPPPQTERTQVIPDQALTKLTVIEENTERIAKAVEEMNERPQT